jgi:hypothetical protein
LGRNREEAKSLDVFKIFRKLLERRLRVNKKEREGKFYKTIFKNLILVPTI